jgi:GntR family transcriptional repressor for pyruvate dehydrogenase complex
MSLGLQPVARSSLSDAVFEQLAAQILAYRVAPGDPLPSERDLVKLLGVNRGAIREGLKRLAQAGLIEQRHGGGTIVLDFRQTGSLALLNKLLFDDEGSPDLEVARSIMEMRAALAPDVARLCAERADPSLVSLLAEVVADMRSVLHSEREASDTLEALQLLSLDFWDLLVTGSDNIAYRLAFNTLRQTYEQIREALIIPMADELRELEEYARVVAAIRVGDPRLARSSAEAIVRRGTEGVLAGIELLGQLEAAAHRNDDEFGDPT